jgi:FtsH-binding integral membrane protein
VIALVTGLLFYASSVVRYTFGVITPKFSIASLFAFNYQTRSNQKTHGAGMAILGLGIIFVAVRAIRKSPARSHAEQVMVYILFGLGVIQVIIGLLALLI